MPTNENLRFEIENSSLAPMDLDGFLPGPVTQHRQENGHRGLATDILVGGVINGAAAGGVSVVLVGLWKALRRHRERRLQEVRSVPVTVSVDDGKSRVDVAVELRGDAVEAIQAVEVEMRRADQGMPQLVRVRFPG
ncbi:MAG: hypothetical protein QG671_2531 [Actinomycetota bacterium]|nr:hypothetical protein [Actinomycetota bacterium]